VAQRVWRLLLGGSVLVFLRVPVAIAQPVDLELTVTEQLLRRSLSGPFRGEGTVRDGTRPAYTITREELQQQGARTVREALRFLPGVNVDSTAGTEVNALSRLAIRGSNTSQVLVLLDGRPIDELGFGGFDLSEISTETIERIEVIPGGGSTLYGSGAIGGVVNILTTQPQTRTAAAELELGDVGFNRQTLTVGDRTDGFSYLFSYSRTQAQNNYFFTIPEANFSGFRQNNDVLYNNFRFQGTLATGRGTLKLNTLYLGKDQGVPGGVPVPNPVFGSGFFNSLTDRQRKYTDQVLTDLLWEQPLGEGNDSTLTARIYYDALNSRFEDRMTEITGLTLGDGVPTLRSRPNTPRQFDNTQRSLGGQLQHRWAFAPAQTLVYGVDYRRTQNRNVARNLVDGSARASYDAELSQGALFGQYLWDFLPGSTLQVGLRQEFASLSRGSQTVPAVGLKVGLGDTTLRANYTRNFRVPNVVNLFSVDPTNIGNPNLKPEVGDSYDVGLDQKLGDIGLLRFTYFVNDIADLIAFESIFPAVNGVSGTYTNLGRVRTTGFEVALNAEIAPNVRVGVNYTNTDPRITEDRNPNLVGRELRFAGADFLNLSLAYDNPSGWYSALWLRSVAGYPTNNTNTESLAGYTTLDFRFRLPLGDRLTLFGGVENLLDQRYQVFAGFPDGGRSWRLGVSGAF